MASMHGRDQKHLDPEVEAMRDELQAKKSEDHDEFNNQLKQQNLELKKKLADAGSKGKDVKHLEAETESARKAKEEQEAAEQAAKAQQDDAADF